MALFVIFVATLTGMLVLIIVRLERAFALYKIRKNYTAAVDAPSVSVCIPARNETHAMTQCLERVLASDYKKMEIVVYDDSSVDDTSILIRSFAHAGVRFVPGSPLPTDWLGKNHALEVLAREASGTYVVFMDVDTFIKPTTISQLVGYTMTEKADMVSVMPGRNDSRRPNVIFGHLRYFWELLIGTAKVPATSSSIWMIKRSALLERFDGFSMFKGVVAAEAALAGRIGRAYRYLVSDEQLGVTYEKKWLSQVETSQRLMVPRAGKATPLALLALFLLNTPTFILMAGLSGEWSIFQTMALWLLLAYMATYSVYTAHMWNRLWWLGGLVWPIVILQELGLFIWSLYGYATHSVTWKGRNVTRVDSDKSTLANGHTE